MLDPRGPRFAQMVGVGSLSSPRPNTSPASPPGVVATAAALVAAFLNAASGLCLGREASLLIRRLSHRPRPARVPTPEGVEA